MAKLARIHFAGMGNISARFNPLTLDFRGADARPAHSVLWLRNGGGKTTMLSLFYSVILPTKREWLGKFHDKPTQLSDYMFDREVGYIIIEFFFADGTRRIVGQSLVKRSAEEVSRVCFTLRSDGPVTLESLPVVGLLPTPAKTREAFFDHVEAENRKDPKGVDLVKFDLAHGYGDWERHLIAIGVDPAVYRSHLVMNSDEGGLGEFFNFKTSDKFIEKLLEMADDPTVLPDDVTGTDQIEAVVDKFRAKVLSMPELEKEARFCQMLADGTKQYRVASGAAATAAKELQDSRAIAAKALRSVRECLQECDAKQASVDLLCKKLASDLQEAESAVSTHGRYRLAYERAGIQLRYQEADIAQSAARRVDAEARLEMSTLLAAEKLGELDHWVGEVRSRQAALNELMANRRPEIAAVENLGTTLWKKIDARVASIQAGIDELNARLKANQTELSDLQGKLQVSRSALTKFSTALAAVNENLKNYERERRAMRETGLIADGEPAPEASARWAAEIQKTEQQIVRSRDESNRLRARAKELRNEAKNFQQSANKESQSAEVPRGQLRTATTTEAELRASRIIQKHGGSTADLHNPGLLQAIQAEVDSCSAQILSRAVNRAADERVLSRHAPPERPVFPVPVAVERVLELLRSKGVRSAVPRYEWLAANCGLGEAENLLVSNPAAASGILLQDSTELSLVVALTNADGIDIPVSISLLADDAAKPGVAHVVLPSERGHFNTEAAATSRGLVQERVNGSRQDQERLTANRKDAERAAGRLMDYTVNYSSETLRRLQADLDRHETTIASLIARAGEAESLASTSDEQAGALQEDGSRLLGVKSDLSQKRAQVDKYITDYHNRVEGWRSAERDANDGIRDSERTIRDLVARVDELGRDNVGINQRLVSQQGDLVQSRVRRDAVPEQYRNGIAQDVSVDIDALESDFRLKRDALERVLSESGLPESIKVAETARGRASDAYNNYLHDQQLRDADVRAARDLHADLKASLSNQQSIAESAKQALILSEQEFRSAKSAMDSLAPLLRDQRSTMHPEWPAPSTRGQAEEYVQKCREIVEISQESKDTATKELARQKEQISNIKGLSSALRPWTEDLERLTAGLSAIELHPLFVADSETAPKFLAGIRREVEAQVSRHADALRRADAAFGDKVMAVLNDADFATARMESRARLLDLASVRAQFDHQIEDIITDINGRIQVIEHSQASLNSERDMVMAAMERRGTAAISLLRSAQNLSVMPAEIPAWSGQCFMKFSVQEKREPTERKSYLRRLLDYWISTNVAIPSGHIMAFDCLLALVGSLDGSGKPQPKGAIGVEILKPEANLRFYYHDILVMRTFSGGELVTAAIILYCVMARLRAKRRGADAVSLAKDSGFLLLDNPVGKANLPDFLDLQIRIADIVGVQYICGTGINDIEALGAFPKVIRLRNSTISRSGAYVVKLDKEIYNPVTAVAIAAKTPVLAKKVGAP